MYEAFYGLSGKPFQLNPDPSFYFGSRQHRRAMAYLEYGLHQNEGFIVITGEIGAGKTTLVRDLLSKLDADEIVAANLVSTQLGADDILRMVAAAFGLPTKQTVKSDLLLSLEAFLVSISSKGKRCLLVVDEAQNLTPKAVEELRMLSNFQLETHALLQSFLIGQPEFRSILQSPELQQLRQRVIASCHIGPMDASETRGYIEHRLKHVGWKDSPQFQTDAYQAIFEASGGVPRRINSVCDRLLLFGFLEEKRVFSHEDVEEIARDMHDEGLASEPPGPGDAAPSDLTTSSSPDFGAPEMRQQIAGNLDSDALLERLDRLDASISRLERCLLRLIGCADRLQGNYQIELPEIQLKQLG
jgi:putative secretion ATPase (PEP-CTERM system associated)